MKIRLDYVTNSSSSSFIIAMKDGTMKSDVLTALEPLRKYIKKNPDDIKCILRYVVDWPQSDDIVDLLEIGDSKSIELACNEIVNYLADELMDMCFSPYETNMNLDEWNVSERHCSNDSVEAISALMYDVGSNIDATDKVKYMTFYQ